MIRSRFYKSLLQSCIEMGTYIAMILLCEVTLHSYKSKRLATVIEGTIIGYYGEFRCVRMENVRALAEVIVIVSVPPASLN